MLKHLLMIQKLESYGLQNNLKADLTAIRGRRKKNVGYLIIDSFSFMERSTVGGER